MEKISAESASEPPVARVREARLKREYAALYPQLCAETWASASDTAFTVMLQMIEAGRLPIQPRRVLDESHFEFRGGTSRGGLPDAAPVAGREEGQHAGPPVVSLRRPGDEIVLEQVEWKKILLVATLAGWEPPPSAVHYPTGAAIDLAATLQKILVHFACRGVPGATRLESPESFIAFLHKGAFSALSGEQEGRLGDVLSLKGAYGQRH